ncbi:MAG: hypothetical protein U5J96_14470 [Ignavibacteriaceae bacterium]|nr:hypothetical protein [Ignavibacteriaceae bacterium]
MVRVLFVTGTLFTTAEHMIFYTWSISGPIVQYYLAAQDENSTISVTLPLGGGGFSPPGSTPPTQFFQFYVAPMNIAFSDSTDNLTTGLQQAAGLLLHQSTLQHHIHLLIHRVVTILLMPMHSHS